MQSLEMLLQIASSSSGMGTTSDNSKGGRGTTSQLDDKMLDSWADPLHALMEAFPDRDPVQVVMAFQVVAHFSEVLCWSQQGRLARHCGVLITVDCST